MPPPGDELSPSKRPPLVIGPAASEPEPLSASFQSEEFLFHIYRGSELLADNCMSEAKDELEQALKMQPRDPEGQGLLGIVYFRLGMYPQALRIYDELLRSFPGEVTPRVNAALCYLKTGQPAPARELLEEVIRREPEHKRAWGYLGLTYERLGQAEKAQIAYERAGQAGRAQRLRSPSSAAQARVASDVRQIAADAVRELDDHPAPFVSAEGTDGTKKPSGRWERVERDRSPVPPAPRAPRLDSLSRGASTPAPSPPPAPHLATPDDLARELSLCLPTEGVVLPTDRVAVARVEQSVAVRLRGLLATLPAGEAYRGAELERRMRGRGLGEPLGTVAAPLGLLEGQGHVVFAASEGKQLLVLRLEGQLLYLREARLVAFEGTVHYENGRLARPDGDHVYMVQLSGQGWVALEAGRGLRSVAVGADPGITVEADHVVGWTGRILPRAVHPDEARPGSRSLVGFVGDGTLLVELPG